MCETIVGQRERGREGRVRVHWARGVREWTWLGGLASVEVEGWLVEGGDVTGNGGVELTAATETQCKALCDAMAGCYSISRCVSVSGRRWVAWHQWKSHVDWSWEAMSRGTAEWS